MVNIMDAINLAIDAVLDAELSVIEHENNSEIVFWHSTFLSLEVRRVEILPFNRYAYFNPLMGNISVNNKKRALSELLN